jgi:LytS/YehU family sensor histidine kinase
MIFDRHHTAESGSHVLSSRVNAHAAITRLIGFSAKQGLFSLTLLTAIGYAVFAFKSYAWLGFFCLMLLPLLMGGFSLLALHKMLSAGWRSTWIVLGISLVLATAIAPWLYQNGMRVVSLRMLNDAQIMTIVAGCGVLALAVPLWQAQSQLRTLHLAELRQAALSSELKALQAQIEPHFLYNTLANTRYLARHDPEKAVQMLDHLITYLHSALPDMRANTSTLGRELELAEHYLALMAIRFGTRLSFQIICPPQLHQASLPPLLLMSLVENAIQHGVEPCPGAVVISIAAEAVQEQLRISVQDNGAGIKAGILGSGVGLINMKQRLAALFGDRASFNLRSSDDGQTTAEFRLPLRIAAEALHE